MDLNISFANEPQREFYYATARNQCFSGGFNNGKTFIGCLKAQTLLFTFPGYRLAIARQTYTDLKKTTMQTFFNSPMYRPEMLASHNEQEGVTSFLNGSLVFWLHLKDVEESTLRGLEVNSVLIDQGEETEEKTYDVLDARIGRWDGVTIPLSLLEHNPNWPTNKFGKLVAPSYHMILANPDTEFHYIYRHYHPESFDRLPDHFFVEGEWDADLGSRESYDKALLHDPEWVEKYVKGKWGRSQSQIHYVPKIAYLDYTPELIEKIKSKGNLFRVLDHGDSSPTCCLWVAALDGVYIVYREYYTPGKLISYHRQAISDLSGNEEYSGNYADPQIFKKTAQKDGGFWSVNDEYRTDETDGPALYWTAADNNEFATRNRINELLRINTKFANPVTKERPSVGIYFMKAHEDYPYGCKETIRQVSSQRRKFLGTINGKSVYSDDRDESTVDHAYDCIRYFVAMHGTQPKTSQKRPPRNSFAFFNKILEMNKYKTVQAGSVQ